MLAVAVVLAEAEVEQAEVMVVETDRVLENSQEVDSEMEPAGL